MQGGGGVRADLWGEQPPAPVAGASPSQQAGEARRQRWHCADPTVWTERMLKTLEEGIEGGRWFRLFDKVFAERTLRVAFGHVWRNAGSAGVDGQSVSAFEALENKELARLSAELQADTYRTQLVKRVYIPKPGSAEKRPLGIPAVRDRVVQGALKAVIEPILEKEFAAQSYGFRPGRGCKDALRRVVELIEAGYTHVVDADLKRARARTDPAPKWGKSPALDRATQCSVTRMVRLLPAQSWDHVPASRPLCQRTLAHDPAPTGRPTGQGERR